MQQSNNFKLKLLSANDSEALYTLIQNNLSRLEDFFAGTIEKTKTLNSTHAYCLEIEQKIRKKEYFPYLIINNPTSKLIGLIDLKNIDWGIPKAELGAFIDFEFEGQGLITALGTNLIAQIVEEHKFKKLFCRVAEKNKRSIRVIERLGFTLEGIIRRDYKTTNGELVDLKYYGRLFD